MLFNNFVSSILLGVDLVNLPPTDLIGVIMNLEFLPFQFCWTAKPCLFFDKKPSEVTLPKL